VTERTLEKDTDMSPRKYRTALVTALLDLLDFVDEKLQEALDDPASQLAAATEAGCAMPLMLERLREDEVIGANFVLVLGTKLERQHWQEWWHDFARMEREEFGREAADVIDRVSVLREVLATKPD
jgi:hypothetical protein